jgi:hypothetical protein
VPVDTLECPRFRQGNPEPVKATGGHGVLVQPHPLLRDHPLLHHRLLLVEHSLWNVRGFRVGSWVTQVRATAPGRGREDGR